MPLVAGTAAWLGRLWCGTTYADILKLFGNPRKAADQHSLDLLQDLHDAGGVAGIFTRFRRGRRICAGVRRGRRRGRFVGDIVVIVGYTIVGVVLFGFVVVDDGVIADICNGFVVFVDGSVLGVNVGQVGAVILVDVAVPDVLVDGDAIGRLDCAFERRHIDVDTVAFGVIGVG